MYLGLNKFVRIIEFKKIKITTISQHRWLEPSIREVEQLEILDGGENGRGGESRGGKGCADEGQI